MISAIGGALWLAIASGAIAGVLPLTLIEVLFLLAPLVAVPLALDLLSSEHPEAPESLPRRAARLLQPPAAVLLVGSFLLPAGTTAAALAFPWLVVTLCVAAGALREFFGSLTPPPEKSTGYSALHASGVAGGGRAGIADVTAIAAMPRTGRLVHLPRAMWRTLRAASAFDNCALAACLYLPVGGTWLITSRAGIRPMGFLEPIVLLTALHFHFAAFVGPILAGSAGRALALLRPSLRPFFFPFAAGAIAGPAFLAAGWALSLPSLKLFAALLLVVSQTGIAGLTLLMIPRLSSQASKVLLTVSAGSAVAGMAAAGVYASGEFAERYFVSIPQMALFHGIANGLGFTLCGLLGWASARRTTAADERRLSIGIHVMTKEEPR